MRSLAFLLVLLTAPAWSAERLVPAEPGALVRSVAEAEAGDVLRLAPGLYQGPVLIDRPLTIEGSDGTRVDGAGKGSVFVVTAPDVTISGLEISGSGSSHQDIDSGVRLLKGADNAKVLNNRITGNLHGVDIHGARNAMVRGNVITGRRDERMNSRGNGVYVWNAPGSKVIGNDVRWGRDGIFVNTSRSNEFNGNRFRDLRFAVHYMYTSDSVVSGNVSIGNHLGYAVMFSRDVTITNNLSMGDRDYGIMLNYANDGQVENNLVRDVNDRCLFVYNAHKNTIRGNTFEGCGVGIHFTAGSERNAILGNAFIGNRVQVKYVGTKWVVWSDDKGGNYWSDDMAFDFDGDGIADTPYRPNDTMDHILWTQPAAKLLLGSPAVQLVRWSQRAFPALLPGGVIDKRPLMHAPDIRIPEWEIGG
jgi:nitrous oxidase accessory protein